MKKVSGILLVFSIVCVSGCDFVRKVAGRPTEAEVLEKAERIECRRLEIRDSIVRDSLLRQEQAARESFLRDSLELVKAERTLDSLGVKLSNVFRFGNPSEALGSKYNLMIGVFRSRTVLDGQMKSAVKKGFNPFLISFKGGVNALCLCGSDTLGVIVDVYKSGNAAGVCPKDAWIYVNE